MSFICAHGGGGEHGIARRRRGADAGAGCLDEFLASCRARRRRLDHDTHRRGLIEPDVEPSEARSRLSAKRNAAATGIGFSSTMKVIDLILRPSLKAASAESGTVRWSIGAIGRLERDDVAPSSIARLPKVEGRMSSQAEPARAGPIESRTLASDSAPRVGFMAFPLTGNCQPVRPTRSATIRIPPAGSR